MPPPPLRLRSAHASGGAVAGPGDVWGHGLRVGAPGPLAAGGRGGRGGRARACQRWIPACMSSFGEFSRAAVIYCFCSNDCSMSDYKCLLAGGPDSENSHDLLPKLMEPQTAPMSPFRHQPHLQGRQGWGVRGGRGALGGAVRGDSGGLEFHPVRVTAWHLPCPEGPLRWHLKEPAPLLSKQKAGAESGVADHAARGERAWDSEPAPPRPSPHPLPSSSSALSRDLCCHLLQEAIAKAAASAGNRPLTS